MESITLTDGAGQLLMHADRAGDVMRFFRLREGERRIGPSDHLLRNDEASGSLL